MTTNTVSYSQKELVTDHVLLRLPVKSLFRFKCVRKSWHDLIKSSSFIKKHFNSESNRLRLMLCKFGVNYNKDPGERSFDMFLLNEKIKYSQDVSLQTRGFIVAKMLVILDVFMVQLMAYSCWRKDII